MVTSKSKDLLPYSSNQIESVQIHSGQRYSTSTSNCKIDSIAVKNSAANMIFSIFFKIFIMLGASCFATTELEVTSDGSFSEEDIEMKKSRLLSCKTDLLELIDSTNANPILIRLAWHDSGTYDAAAENLPWPKRGGANGSIRFFPELGHGANAGLTAAINLLTPIKEKYPDISWADIIQMASATSIEHAGGPKIDMIYGRIDVASAEDCPKEGNLPGAAAPFPDNSETPQQHLRNVFYRMGLNDKEIVALSGAHTVGRAHKNRSGFGKESTKFTEPTQIVRRDGKSGIGSTVGGSSWTSNWLHFDNSYFKVMRGNQVIAM